MLLWPWLALAFAAPPYPRVFGGVDADPDAWPHAGAVVGRDRLQCSAVLIHPQVALTAGHCRSNLDTLVLHSATWTEGGERIPIADTFQHPDYLDTYDVTVLILERPALTPPAPLALDCATDALYDGAEAWIVGFGATDAWATESAAVLQVGETRIADADCDGLDAGCNPDVSPGGELRAEPGVDSCHGDSGGPLYVEGSRGVLLAGITSRGAEPADTPCGGGGIYVRVDPVVSWIEGVAGVSLDRPDCSQALNQAPVPASPGPLRLRAGSVRTWPLLASDPEDQALTWSILNSPPVGVLALTAAGALTYTAPPDAGGIFAARVAVTDSGEPALSRPLDLWITVVPWPEAPSEPEERGCGCASTDAQRAPALLAAALTALALRRRRR